MGLSAEQIKLVQGSWEAVKTKGDLESHGLAAFEKLFTDHPLFYDVFPYAKGYKSWADLKGTDKMKWHAGKVMGAIDKAVLGMDNVGQVESTLETLGSTHVNHPVKAEHFPLLGDAIVFALGNGLGDKWTSETKDAWNAMYGVISASMIKGMSK